MINVFIGIGVAIVLYMLTCWIHSTISARLQMKRWIKSHSKYKFYMTLVSMKDKINLRQEDDWDY